MTQDEEGAASSRQKEQQKVEERLRWFTKSLRNDSFVEFYVSSTELLRWRKSCSTLLFSSTYSQFQLSIQRTSTTTIMMMNKHSTLALMALLASSNAFAPDAAGPRSAINVQTSATASPYFIDVLEEQQQSTATTEPVVKNATTKMKEPRKVQAKKGGSTVHKQGIFSPAVLAAKQVLGDENLNKVRAKAISMHSDVIASFVDTYEWPTGQAALKALFAVADKDGSGTIDEKELNDALLALGFTWLKEKQVKGIFARADTDENGAICLQEFMNEAPKTLRTNLIKLAKQNGGELGFLV